MFQDKNKVFNSTLDSEIRQFEVFDLSRFIPILELYLTIAAMFLVEKSQENLFIYHLCDQFYRTIENKLYSILRDESMALR